MLAKAKNDWSDWWWVMDCTTYRGFEERVSENGGWTPIYSHFKWWRWLWIIGFLGLPMGALCSSLVQCSVRYATPQRYQPFPDGWMHSATATHTKTHAQLFWFLFLMPLYCHIGSAFRLSWAISGYIFSPLVLKHGDEKPFFFREKHVLITSYNQD